MRILTTRMGRTIVLVNQKGGVGKTTTAVNLAAYFAKAGKRVLLVDLDPQANASAGIGVRVAEGDKHVYHSLLEPQMVTDIVRPTAIPNLSVVPAHADLAGAAVELVNEEAREYRLHQALDKLRHDYDYIMIDCPPSLGLLTVNGLVAADHVLIPTQAEYYALEGLGQLLNTVNLIQTHLKPNLTVLGCLITMYDPRSRLAGAVLEELRQHFPGRLFETTVPRNVRLAEAPSFGKPIADYDAHSRGAQAYESLAKELLAFLEPAQ